MPSLWHARSQESTAPPGSAFPNGLQEVISKTFWRSFSPIGREPNAGRMPFNPIDVKN